MPSPLAEKILALLIRDPQLSKTTIAHVLGVKKEEIAREVETLVASGEIAGFKTVLNTNKLAESVTAMVEVKVAPRRGRGFDEIAERIARCPEVVSVYLISGSHDLNVQVRGKTLQDVAGFVSNKLAGLEDVLGTQTHFILKKYKDDGVDFGASRDDTRLPVSA